MIPGEREALMSPMTVLLLARGAGSAPAFGRSVAPCRETKDRTLLNHTRSTKKLL